MAREGTPEDPAVPPDVGAPPKHFPCPQKAPEVVSEGPDPDIGDSEAPKAAQNTLEAPDVAVETSNPDVLWARNGHQPLLVDSDTDVEEEGPNLNVSPQKWLKMTQNVPETPDVGRTMPNPDVLWLKNGHGTLVVESDTDVEEADSDVESSKRLTMTQNVPETPDVAAKTPNPDVSGPKMCHGMELADSDTDVEEDPDVQPPKRLRVAQNVPGIPAVEVESPNPAVEAPRIGRWMLLVESDTDEEGEEESPDVQPQKQLRMTQNVPKTPDVAAKAPNPDVSGPKVCHQMLLGDSDTDVENEVNPDVQPPKSLRMTQSLPRIPAMEVKTPNPAVERPKIGHRMLVVDSDTDVEEDPDVKPPKRLKRTRNVPKMPDVQLGTANPGISGPRITCQVLLVDSDTDVEEDSDVEPSKRFRVIQNITGTPNVAVETPSPDLSGPGIGCQMFLVDRDRDVEEEVVNPDVEPLRKLGMTPNVPESSDVGLKTPNPDVGRTKNERQALLGDSETEEEEVSPDVRPSKRPPNVPKSSDVPSQTPNPAVEGSQRGHRMLLEDSNTDVEEANPDVGSLKKQETALNVPETPDVRLKTPNPDVAGTRIECGTLLGDSETDVEEEVSPDVRSSKRTKITPNMPETPDVPIQTTNPDVEGPQRGHGMLLVDCDPDVEDKAYPDVWPSKRRKITPNLPETPGMGPNLHNRDVGRLQGTQNLAKIPDVEGEEEGWDPDVATQLFLPPNPDVGAAKADPDAGSPKRLKTTQNPPKTADVEEEEESDPDVATQLFLLSPDIGSPESPKTAPKDPNIPDVEGLPSLDPDVATQLFLPSDPDVEDHPNPGVLDPKWPQMASNEPRISDVSTVTPNPGVDVEEDFDVATQLFLPPSPDVEGEQHSDPDIGSPQTPKTPLNHPQIPDVEAETPNPDVEGAGVPCPDPDVATQLLLAPSPDVEGERPLDPDAGSLKPLKTPPKLPEIPDMKAETPKPDVEEPGVPCPDPDVATQLFLPLHPDVERPKSPETAPNEPRIPDWEPPNPDAGSAPSPAQDAEAPPTPQVRRSLRLAESRGARASLGPTPTRTGHDQEPKPCPSPKPRPQRRQDRGRGRGLSSAPPPQEEEPAEGVKRSLRPRAAPGPTHIRVLFTGLVASPALLVALEALGGTEATSVTDCSHLVTDGIRRTLKFLCALGRGIPIVTPQWLLESSHGGRPLSPGPFLPRDHPRERRFGFRLRPALARAQTRPLLQGYQVHVTPSVQPCPEDMRDIVTCCGGTFLPQLPREHAPRVLVISCPQDCSLWAPAVAAGLPLLSAELLLSGVLRQRLDIAQFLLTPLNPPNLALKTPHPLQKPQNLSQNPSTPQKKRPNPPQKHRNPPQKPPNPAQNTPNPAQNTSTPPQTPPPSPPRTRSGRRPPENHPPKPPNSGTPQNNPNLPQKTLKQPQSHSEGPDPNFGVQDLPQELPRTRSRRGQPQNPPWDPPNSGIPKKNPKRPQKNANAPQSAPKQPRGPLGDPNPNFGVPYPPADAPQESPRTRSGWRPPPNSGAHQKTSKQPQKNANTPQNAPKQPRGPPGDPNSNSGVPYSPPDNPQESPRTRSGRRPPPDLGVPQKTTNLPPKAKKQPQNAPNPTPKLLPKGPHPKFGVPEPPSSLPQTRSRRGPPQDAPKSQ